MAPCIGESLSFDFFGASMAYSNLGDMGPDAWAPPVIRYVNVGYVSLGMMGTLRFDLEVSNRSSYLPFNSSLNRIHGRFAQINLASGTHVDLRVSVFLSCCTAGNCGSCDDLAGAERSSCYASGCCCFSTTCYTEGCCDASAHDSHRANYSCAQMSTPLVLPGTALVGMSVFDFDGGVSGEYVESLTLVSY